MTSEAKAPRFARAAIILVFFALAVGLRVENARTAYIHDDELHYVADASWLVTDIGARRTLDFLRQHPHDHRRLMPYSGFQRRWGRFGQTKRVGHPPLMAVLWAPIFHVLQPQDRRSAVMVGRIPNAIVDSLTVPLLPLAATALGLSATAGLVAAGFYAVFPPAVAYGSIANLDPPLAPLALGLLICLFRGKGPRWYLAGVITGLMIATKQTGLAAILFFPPLALISRRATVSGFLRWGLALSLVVAVLVSPFAYARGLFAPIDPYATVRADVVTSLWRNLEMLSSPDAYYWLSYARHGGPLAPLMASTHLWMTNLVLLLFAASIFVPNLLGRSARAALILPFFAVMTLLPPSDGMWRIHLLLPMFCLGAASLVSFRSVPAYLASIACAFWILWTITSPLQLGDGGAVDLAKLAARNPHVSQPQGFYSLMKPLSLFGADPSNAVSFSARLREPIGKYALHVESKGEVRVLIDGKDRMDGGLVEGTGRIVDLHVELDEGARLSQLHLLAGPRP